jgi:hypothetical protein
MNPNIHVEAQKTSNSQSNPKQKRTKFQIILQNHSNKNIMVMAQKHIGRTKDQIEDPPSHSHLILTKEPKTYIGKKTDSSKIVLRKLDIHT